ncbi:MAG: ABC transporter substrate-binding protein [Microvirga sp.]
MLRRMMGKGKWIAAALSLVALGATSSISLAGKANDTLSWISRYPIDAIDPYYNTAREAILINSQLVWDTLIWRDPDSGEYKPLLAKSWKWVDDTTLDFTLRDDVKWHDGKPFNADDAVYTISRVTGPDAKIPPAVAWTVAWIKGAEKTGDHSFRLLLKAPFPAALEHLASLVPILPNNLYGSDNSPPSFAKAVGTGPYKVTAFTASARIDLELTGRYFSGSPKGQPTIKRITYRVVPDNSTQIAELLSGGADWIWNVSLDQTPALAARKNVVVQSAETMRFSFITFNLRDREDGQKNPLQDYRVRAAIAHALDREKMIKAMVGEGAQVPLASCYKSQFGCDQNVKQHAYDPTLAKKLLAEAGYSNGLTLDLQATRSRDWTAVVANYLNAVGIKTTINYISFPAAEERRAKNQDQVYLLDNGWFSINDTSAVFNPFFTGTKADSVPDPEFIGWVREASSVNDSEKRKAIFSKALNRMADRLYWFPMWTHPNFYAINADLDFKLYTDENPRFYFMKWK